MAPKRRMEEAHPRGASIPMHSPPDQRTVGSPQALTATGRFRCGIATLASSKSSITTQSGDDTASAEHTIAQAERDPATIQPVANATHGLDHLLQPRTTASLAQHRRDTAKRIHNLLHPSSQSYILNTGKGKEEEMVAESLAHYQQIGEGQHTTTSTDNLPQVMVTESLAQYQQTGECRMAHIRPTQLN